MNKEMDQLKHTEQDVKEKKKTADSNSHEVSHHVSAWLDDVQKMKDKTQNIPTSRIKWFNVAKRYKAGKQSYAIRGQIKALVERNKSDINWTNEQKSLAKCTALTTYISYSTGKNLEEREKTIISTASDQEIDVISEMDAYIPNVTYPSYLLHTCHHLQHLQLGDDERVEVVFDMDSSSSSESPTIRDTQPPLILPYLNVLELYQLNEMSHVWKCNWNKFVIPQHQPLEFPFQNLTDISLWNCPRIKYLFSPLVAKYVSNLMWVNIDECDGIEEVISGRDDENEENTSTSSHKDTTFFPHLNILMLSNLSCLKRIDGGDTRSGKISSNTTNAIHDQFQSAQVIGACWSLCQYPRQISIHNCDTVSSLIPWYAAPQMKRLEKLKIKLCKTMVEVFESNLMNTYSVDEESATPRKNIATVVPQLSNLKSVFITECDVLSHVFTFSTLESLKQLKELRVERCFAIQVIVKEENETSSKLVVFPRLETIELDDLPNLKGFFLGMNNFRWPSLDNFMINDCPQLVVFTSGHSNTPKLKYIRTSLGKHNLECGLNFHGTINQTAFPSSDPIISKGMPCSFHNLVELSMGDRDVGTIIPYNVLLQLQKLEEIHLKSCNSVEEIFEVGPKGTNTSDFNESQTIVKVPNLRQVNLEWLDGLKYLWNSNRWMALEFPNLTSVSIQLCYSLEHVFTYSMVGSLLQLQDLRIGMCDNIEVIVKEEEDFDAKVNEIMLPRLKSIKLEYLSSLKGFWRRPQLLYKDQTRRGASILEHADHTFYLQGFTRIYPKNGLYSLKEHYNIKDSYTIYRNCAYFFLP
ncbi:hypothetical protein L1987_71711 [Smallanthus sonchifolius]|uniref:Uncharacterized protein n=1 Tax=Smallanthus sonchifolius TaxID=185202 RepID=A0ACB9AU08_9ASTR|nr:hypothetical protein L1987_71711 [Smallanthus sonchifolius]